MKLKSSKFEAYLPICGKRQICKITLEEYKTMWKFTGKADGHDLPFAIEWRYGKSEYQDEIQAVTAFFAEVENKYK